MLISILLLVDDVVFLALSPEELQRQLHALSLFCDLRHFTINLGKTKVMIFYGLKTVLSDHHLTFKGEEIEIATTYTYMGGYNSQDLASVSNLPFNPKSIRTMDP